MKVLMLTRHYFSDHYRKTTVHFLAMNIAREGNEVAFATVGRSRLASVIGRRSEDPPDLSRRKPRSVLPGVRSLIVPEWLHPISRGPKFMQSLLSPSALRYGRRIPGSLKKLAAGAEMVIIECGYGVAYFDALKSMLPNATFVYLATDPLDQVGLRREFVEIERAALPKFDLVRYASPQVSERFPEGTRAVHIPQGVAKDAFDACTVNPYTGEGPNIVCVGDMSFDKSTVVTIAENFPQAQVHIFGAPLGGDLPPNIIAHGEVGFAELVGYIKFADVGLMPYKVTEKLRYLAHTSLKYLQYSYCNLPMLSPQGIEWNNPGVHYYDPDNAASILRAVSNALAAQKAPSAVRVLDWSDCARQLLANAR